VITTYSELQTAIAQWLHRSDLTTVIPDFIALVEEKLNRYLRTKDNELALSPTAITNNRITAPANTVAVKTLWLDGYEGTPLKAQTIESVIANGTEGLATMFAWQGSELVFDGTGTVEGVLYRSIPALSVSNTSNWVLTGHPSVYLFGAVAEANLYIKNPEEAAQWGSRFQAAMDEINGNSMRDTMNGPLVARAR
jgi:hypothetical protein